MNRNTLIAYATSFVSFILDSRISEEIRKIILFGSVARGIFDEESDIDLFIDTEREVEVEIKKILSLFQHSDIQKRWEIKGLKNNLSVHVGNLDKWKLKRGAISDGIILYGKFKEAPEHIEYYLFVRPSFRRFSKSQKVKIWRQLYGYKQKVGKKVYVTQGLVEKIRGKRIENGLIIKMSNKKDIIDFLNKKKIDYTVHEIWSDSLE